MNERYEFKVWHKDKHYMYKNVAVGVGDNKIGYRLSGKSRYSWENTEEIVILQYTGFIDSKGKKIFDGDILKFGTSKTYLMSVHWREYKFVFKKKGSTKLVDKFSQWNKIGNVLVLGNIYENPELLSPNPQQ